MTVSEKKKFQAENPKQQMFTKTDLAKFDNVWDSKPTFVNLGAQKNFLQYAKRIGSEWKKSNENFNEFYFKRSIARAIMFRTTEKLVSIQPWYNGGYRANIVAYTLAVISYFCIEYKRSIDFLRIWADQSIDEVIESALITTAKIVYDEIIKTPEGISNVTEWCKKDACWEQIKGKIQQIDSSLPEAFKAKLIDINLVDEQKRAAKKTQNIDDGIQAQRKILEVPSEAWKSILEISRKQKMLSEKEEAIILIACQIPKKIPSEKQSLALVGILSKLEDNGIVIN